METKGNCGVRDGSKRLQKQTKETKDIGEYAAWNVEKQAPGEFLTVEHLNLGMTSGRLANNEWGSCNSPRRCGR
jgi:hypothetical protein